MLAYFSALPGKNESEATAPITPTSTTSTGRYETILKVFAFFSLYSYLPVPFLYAIERIQKNKNSGSRMNMATNIHVSVEWMLMGGWNHQYATAAMTTMAMIAMMIAFLPHVAILSPNETSTRRGLFPPPDDSPSEPPSPEEFPENGLPPLPTSTPDWRRASNKASIPDVCFTNNFPS